VRNRFQAAIALIAIALQALDVVVGGLGHSHDHGVSAVVETRHSACCHHDHDAPPPASDEQDHHDYCSLCRHFSQPVAPVMPVADVERCDRFEAFVPTLVAFVDSVVTSTHLARGPPASCA
jgi:hypothetical protein